MLNLNSQYLTTGTKTPTTTSTNSLNSKNQVTLDKLTSGLSVCKVQINPANTNNVTAARQLANSLASLLNDNGISAFVSNNSNLNEANIVVNLYVGSSRYTNFKLRYFSNPSLTLATTIQNYLWFYSLANATITHTSRQRLYELARQGIIPVDIIFPGNTTDLLTHGNFYCKSVSSAVTAFIVRTVSSAVSPPVEAAPSPAPQPIFRKMGIITKLHCRSRLLFNVKRTNNNINRMYRQAG